VGTCCVHVNTGVASYTELAVIVWTLVLVLALAVVWSLVLELSMWALLVWILASVERSVVVEADLWVLEEVVHHQTQGLYYCPQQQVFFPLLSLLS